MPIGLSNKDGRIFFVKLVSHTFPDKEPHKHIIYEYILKLEITESNTMKGFQRELQRHIRQYDAIQGSEWKKITNHIIRQYQKIDSTPFNTGYNMLVVTGPEKAQTKYGWLCTLIECHDLISPRQLHRQSKAKGHGNGCFTTEETTATLFHGGDTFTCDYHPKTKIPTLRCIKYNKKNTTYIQAASTLAQKPSNKGHTRHLS
jgi:hypothetical protein